MSYAVQRGEWRSTRRLGDIWNVLSELLLSTQIGAAVPIFVRLLKLQIHTSSIVTSLLTSVLRSDMNVFSIFTCQLIDLLHEAL
jgi:hypothetical protein